MPRKALLTAGQQQSLHLKNGLARVHTGTSFHLSSERLLCERDTRADFSVALCNSDRLQLVQIIFSECTSTAAAHRLVLLANMQYHAKYLTRRPARLTRATRQTQHL